MTAHLPTSRLELDLPDTYECTCGLEPADCACEADLDERDDDDDADAQYDAWRERDLDDGRDW